MRHDPHLLIEGCLIAGFAMGANAGYIYMRGEFIRERERLQAAVDQAYEAKLIGKNNCARLGLRHLRPSRRRRLHLRRGDRAARKPRRQEGPAAAEAAVPGQCRPLRLPDHREQRRDRSRRCPTSCGAARPGSPRIGRPNNTGTKLFCISGHVKKPCNVEEAMGIPLRELLETHAGGVRGGWDNLLAVIPGRLVDAAGAGRRRSGRHAADGFRRLPRQEVGARHRRRDRHGQVDRHRPRDGAHLVFLQARELRPVHALPRRHGLDVARADAHGGRPRAEARDRHADGRDQADRRPHHLRLRRRRGLAGAGPAARISVPRSSGASTNIRATRTRALPRGGGVGDMQQPPIIISRNSTSAASATRSAIRAWRISSTTWRR